MARPGRPERNRTARSFRQLRRFHHVINSDKVFGTHRRPTIDDVGELDKVLGRSARCLLTTSGIIHDNHRFHDKEITSELLDRLLRHAPKRDQRRGRSSGKVMVLGTWDPGDCSFIQVWDWVLK